MATVAIIGAGFAGHTAALYLKQQLGKDHEVIMINRYDSFYYIPSWVWVGVGTMKPERTGFKLEGLYLRRGIKFIQGKATEVHPDDNYLIVERDATNEIVKVAYDYLIVATGPKLNFAATPGLGPDANSLSVCTPGHAEQASAAFDAVVDALREGRRQTLVIGVGHGTCTCEGAAFEYTFNVDHELRERGVRDLADVIYLSNEYDLGDFGVGGMTFAQNGFETSSKLWTESLFRERGVRAILRAHVERVDEGVLHYELLDGTKDSLTFDFAMLLPPFRGADVQAFDRDGAEITAELFAPSGFLKVDADYDQKPFEEWTAEDWPKTYQCPRYSNVFGVGIAFAPPHAISQPRKSPNGTVISPAPPRTGMPSGVMGRVVARSVADRINKGDSAELGTASMAAMGAACIASAGMGMRKGTAAAMTMYPIVPDLKRFPRSGRDVYETSGEIGLGAHWTKLMLHYLFLYKAKARLGWHLIPE